MMSQEIYIKLTPLLSFLCVLFCFLIQEPFHKDVKCQVNETKYRCRELVKLGGKMREIWLKDEDAIWYADCCTEEYEGSLKIISWHFKFFFLILNFFAVSNIVAKCFSHILCLSVYKLCLFAISFCDLIFHIQYTHTHESKKKKIK